jgi:hypothetical protein
VTCYVSNLLLNLLWCSLGEDFPDDDGGFVMFVMVDELTRRFGAEGEKAA